jgi:hypothetical protein
MDTPWIEVRNPNQDLTGFEFCNQETKMYWHAFFVCQVKPRPFEELTHFKWGFNLGALMEEALERQRLFIGSQNFPGDKEISGPEDFRTLALRCIRNPNSSELGLSLIGKACGQDPEKARQLAYYYWQEIQSIFPYDYTLIPAKTSSEYQQLTGLEYLPTNNPEAYAEVEKFEGLVSGGEQFFYYYGSWTVSTLANEQIWRAMAGADFRVMFNVILRPSILMDSERAILHEMQQRAQKIAEESKLPHVKPFATSAAELYSHWSLSLNRPYIVQMQFIAPDGIVEYLPRVAGFALTHNQTATTNSQIPQFQIRQPRTAEDANIWRECISWLEPDLRTKNQFNERLSRISKLVDLNEANTLFRLPFPPEKGIPGLKFK